MDQAVAGCVAMNLISDKWLKAIFVLFVISTLIAIHWSDNTNRILGLPAILLPCILCSGAVLAIFLVGRDEATVFAISSYLFVAACQILMLTLKRR